MTHARALFRDGAGDRRGDCRCGHLGPGDQAQAESSKRLDKISDYARHGYAITVQCRSCGHSAKLDAKAISAEAVRRNLSRDIGAIEGRLRCQKCGKRNILCGPALA